MLHQPKSAFTTVERRPTQRHRTSHIRNLALGVWNACFRWLRRRAVRRTLSELDDRMLRDIGITRADIEDVARGRVPPSPPM
jgi:uncharacterized protein YjiS (DUF1127 family)